MKLTHPEYLERLIGAVPIGDFDGKRIGNDQPYRMFRQLARNAIKQTRLKKAHRLEGRVLLPDGSPAAGAKVKTATKYKPYAWKFHSADGYGSSNQAVTDRNGRFSIVTDKPASFTAMMPGQAPLIIDDLDKYIQLVNGDAASDYRLPPPIRLAGRIPGVAAHLLVR